MEFGKQSVHGGAVDYGMKNTIGHGGVAVCRMVSMIAIPFFAAGVTILVYKGISHHAGNSIAHGRVAEETCRISCMTECIP